MDSDDKKTITLYHGTLTKNVPSILEKGVIPRDEDFCEHLIETKGKDAPEWAKKSAKRRCLDTAREVSLSGNKDYAIGNCRAGLEAESYLIEGREGKTGKEVWEGLRKQNPCSVLKVTVPADVVPLSGGGRWEGEPIGRIIEDATQAFKGAFPEMAEDYAKKGKEFEEFTLKSLEEFTFGYVSPDWIVDVEHDVTPWFERS